MGQIFDNFDSDHTENFLWMFDVGLLLMCKHERCDNYVQNAKQRKES